jgi:hypothetical protein
VKGKRQAKVQSGPEDFGQIYSSIKNYELPEEKRKTNYISWMHTLSFFIHSAQFNVNKMCRTENIVWKFQPLPRASQLASTDCCGDIPAPCLEILNSRNLGSIDPIHNINPKKQVYRCNVR